jgi:hypothetical protein
MHDVTPLKHLNRDVSKRKELQAESCLSWVLAAVAEVDMRTLLRTGSNTETPKPEI